MRFDNYVALVDLALVKASTGGSTLSAEMTLLLALIQFDGYELFPAHDTESQLARSRSQSAGHCS